jgi:hypothetical protein
MVDFLVKAYYEIYGSFDGIEWFKYFSRIVEAAQAMRVGVEEFCYRSLGYSYDNMYSAEYRAHVRKEAVKEPLETFRSRFSVPKNKDIMPVLRTYGFMPMFRKGVDRVVGLGSFGVGVDLGFIEDVVRVVTNYIETTEHVTMYSKAEKKSVALVNFFSSLKFYSDFTKLTRVVPQYVDIVKSILENVVVVENLEENAISVDGIIFVKNHFDVKKVSEAVCLQIGCRYLDMPKKHYYYLIGKMPFYQANSNTNSSVYLGMLDLAHAYDRTLKELFEFVGVEYVNQLEVLEESGVFVYQSSDAQFEVLNPVDGDGMLHKVGLEKLNSMFVSDTLRYVGVKPV